MKSILILFATIIFTTGQTQTLTGKLENPLQNMPEMDIVLWPLGLDSAVTIGKLTVNELWNLISLKKKSSNLPMRKNKW